MSTFLVRRGLFAVLVLFAVTFLSFVLVYLSGDPARALAGVDTTQENLERIRETYGLNRPLHEQYLYFVERALHSDLGRSYRYRVEVLPLVVEKFGITLELAVASLALSTAIALPLGVIAAIRKDTFTDHASMIFSLLGVSTPGFWLGIILILIFADQFRLLPPSGRGDGAKSLILPAIALSGFNIGLMTRLMRRSMIEELGKPYVVVARAKGLPDRRVVLWHAFRNALLPTVTVGGLQFGALLGGSIVVETVFAWPGIGFLMIDAIRTNDLPVIRAVVFIVGLSFVAINLMIDLLYGVLDPRIRLT